MSIELKNLSKSYDGNTLTLKDVSVRIETGEFFAIVGPSGCGKSTLLRMIAGLIPATDGNVLIDEKDVTNLPPQDRNLTMVFQNYALFPFLTVKDNVAFGLKARKVDQTKIDQRVVKALEMVDLAELGDRKPKELSGGQRQRVALARAIASDAKICLMDEPLSNLDAQLRTKMRAEIRELQQHLVLTVIYVTHDQVEAMTMADRIMVLHDHEVQQIGTPLQIYQDPRNAFVGQFFGTPRMNLLETTPNEGQLQTAAPLYFAKPAEIEPHNCLIGIRPVNLTILTDVSDANARIENVEYLGTQLIIEATMDDGQEVRIVQDTEQADLYGVNQRIKIVPNGKFFIFDQKGQRIGQGEEEIEDGTITEAKYALS